MDSANRIEPVSEASSVDPLVSIRASITDTNHQPITSVSIGDDFYLDIHVEDMRANSQRVFSAYMDISFDERMVQPTEDGLAGVQFAAEFENLRIGDFRTPGLIDEIGAFGSGAPNSSKVQHLLTIPFRAISSGAVEFAIDPGERYTSEVLLLGLNHVIDPADVVFEGAFLLVNES